MGTNKFDYGEDELDLIIELRVIVYNDNKTRCKLKIIELKKSIIEDFKNLENSIRIKLDILIVPLIRRMLVNISKFNLKIPYHNFYRIRFCTKWSKEKVEKALKYMLNLE